MAQESSETHECAVEHEASTTLLILLMNQSQTRLQEILFGSNERVLDEVQRAFKEVPSDFLQQSQSQIDQFRCRVNRMIMHHQRNSNQRRMNQLRSALGCLKKIRKL